MGWFIFLMVFIFTEDLFWAIIWGLIANAIFDD